MNCRHHGRAFDEETEHYATVIQRLQDPPWDVEARLTGGGASPLLIEITRDDGGIWQAGIGGEGTWIANYYPDSEAAENGAPDEARTITTKLPENCADSQLIAIVLAARIFEAEWI